jgi:hypothetical protein
MKLRSMLIIAAIVALLYALGLLLVPGFMATTYGMGTSASEILLARFFGTTLLIVGLITWLAKDQSSSSLRPIVTASLTGDAVGFIVSLMGTLSGATNAMGWSAVVIYLLLALGFAYFQFVAPAE